MKRFVLAGGAVIAAISPALAATDVQTQITVEAAIFGAVLFGALSGVATRSFPLAVIGGIAGAALGAVFAQM